ncbi:hypothetical protein ACQKMD_15460 [Viridibacillus sp. NPDC096237]|uniref:hypothetical protein n=1 Tax=Viridibacillus sp. NPDC096237 TaxID=3390721 RepID=UPI003D07B293
MLEMLKKYKLTAKKTHLRFGHKFNKESYFLFLLISESLSIHQLLGKHLELQATLGFKVKAHTLRHTYASLLISSGVDVVTVVSRLGDTEEMVFKVYAHAVDENKNQTIEVFKNMLENN